jgi:hypothetical protein
MFLKFLKFLQFLKFPQFLKFLQFLIVGYKFLSLRIGIYLFLSGKTLTKLGFVLQFIMERSGL